MRGGEGDAVTTLPSPTPSGPPPPTGEAAKCKGVEHHEDDIPYNAYLQTAQQGGAGADARRAHGAAVGRGGDAGDGERSND